ncbi:MAG: flagellar hook-length control protein FliK [Bacteroidota bacterium]
MSNLSFIPAATSFKPTQDFQHTSLSEKKTEFDVNNFDQFLKSASEKQFETDSFQERTKKPRSSDGSNEKLGPKKDEYRAAEPSPSEKRASQSNQNQETDTDGEIKEAPGAQVESTEAKVAAEITNEGKQKVEVPENVNQEEILALLAHLAEVEAVIRGETQPETVQTVEINQVMSSVEGVANVQEISIPDGNKLEGAKLVETGSEIPVINATEADSVKLNKGISTEGNPVDLSQIQVLSEGSGNYVHSEGKSFSNQGQNPDAKGQISELVKANPNANQRKGNESLTFDRIIFTENQKAETDSQLSREPIITQHGQSFEKGGKVDLALIQTHLAVNDAPEAKTEMPVLNIVPSQPSVSNSIQAQPSGTAEVASTSREELFSQLVEHAKVVIDNGGSEMEVNLRPEHLGKLQLKVTIENEVVTAKFVAESQQVKEIIESNLSQLKRNLQENGMEVDTIMVSVGNHQGSDGFEQAAYGSENSSNLGGRSELVEDDLVLDDESHKPLAQSDTVIDLIA